jgi:hypothetical protein
VYEHVTATVVRLAILDKQKKTALGRGFSVALINWGNQGTHGAGQRRR